jgi:hypothetical protein
VALSPPRDDMQAALRQRFGQRSGILEHLVLITAVRLRIE